MSLEQLSKTVDFVQDATPSNANDGETYLDTSQSPPRLKVFDSSVGSFIEPRSIQNLDAPVSAAGANLRFTGGFQLALASFSGQSLNVFNQASTPVDVAFNNDGTKMFILQSGVDVHEYSLSKGFDVSTASFTGTVFAVDNENPSARGLAFSDDGTAMFVVGDSQNEVNKYDLSSAFDISTATFSFETADTNQNVSRGIAFSSDGRRMYIAEGGDQVIEFELNAPFDLNATEINQFDTGAQESDLRNVTFNNDGTKMFVIGGEAGSQSIHEYALTSAFDFGGTVSFTGTSLDVSAQAVDPRDVEFSEDGTKMFVTGRTSDSVHEYIVGTVGPK